MDKIYVHGTNTSVIPNDSVTGGSTTSEALCRAAELACETLLERLAPFADEINAAKKEAHAQEITDGKQPKGSAAPTASWGEMCGKAWSGGGGTESLSVNRKYSTKNSKIDTAGYFGLGAGVTEVEVDVLTGQVSVLRADILYDCGHSLNPTIDIGQVSVIRSVSI